MVVMLSTYDLNEGVLMRREIGMRLLTCKTVTQSKAVESSWCCFCCKSVSKPVEINEAGAIQGGMWNGHQLIKDRC